MNGTSIPGLIRRSITASLGASLTVALLTVALAAAATGVPRAVHTLLTSGLRYEVAELPVTQRDLLSSSQGVVEPGPAAKPGTNTLPAESDAVWGRLDDALAEFHDSMPSQVRKRFGPARFHVTLDPHATRPVEPGVGAPDSVVILGLDPRLADHIQMVKGSAPAPIIRALPDRDNSTDLILSVKAAELMHWPVGQERTMDFDTSPSQTVRLSGTYEAKDADDPYWQHTVSAREPTVIEEGLTKTIMGVGWLDASSWPSVAPISSEADLRAWYPLDVDTLESSEAGALETELREFTRIGQDIPQQGDVLDWTGSPIRNVFSSLAFGTKTTDAIAAAEITGTSSLSMIAMTASGPLGVILAVLMMGAALVIARRRDGLSLAWARGASAGQLRTVLAVEGLLIGLPAAAVGTAIAIIAIPGTTGLAGFLLPVVVGLLPAVLMLASPLPDSIRAARSDLSSGGTGRWRLLGETLLVAAAAVAVLALQQRGFSAEAGVDPLLAATPLLLTIAACVLVLRIYPAAVTGLLALMRRRPGPVGILGAARALRDPAAGLAAVLAMVAAVSIAVFSGAALATVQNGFEASAEVAIGADLAVDGPAMSKEQIDKIRSLSGVAEVAPIYDEVSTILSSGGQESYISMLVVDSGELRSVQKGVSGALSLPASMDKGLSVVASTDIADRLRGVSDATLDGKPVRLAGTGPARSPFTNRVDWLMVDRDGAAEILGGSFSPERLYVSLDKGAAAPAVQKKVQSILGPEALVKTPGDKAEELQDNPAIPGLRTSLLVAVAAVTALAAIAIVMTLVRGGPARRRQHTVVRVLGMTRRQSRSLIAWEVGPLAAVALVAGGILGTVLPFAVLGGIDLRQFTGGDAQPAITLDPLLTAGVIGAVLGVVLLAAGIAIALTRRVEPAEELRFDAQ